VFRGGGFNVVSFSTKEYGKMKKLLISLVVMSFVCAGTVQAQLGPVAVDNYSFELPGQGDAQVLGWNGDVAGYPDDIPGWVGEDGSSNSGVENPYFDGGIYQGTDGLYAGLLGAVDPSAWNLTDHTIAAGEIFRLTVDASNTYTSSVYPSFKVTLYYDDAGARTVGNSETFTLSTGAGGDIGWDTYSIDFDADTMSASIGNKIGIELENATPGDVSWMIMDDVRLDIIPEPATMTLLGLGSLALLKRRRA
jgi:hapalindole biogenesis HpiC1 cyclase-like protein/PEP-CTERM motif-containing protein